MDEKPLPEHQKRKHPITCRLTDEELSRIDFGKPQGTSRGEWIRTKALSRKIPRAIPEINRKAWAELSRVASNLNQLTRFLNQGNGNLSATLIEVATLRKKLLGLTE